MKSLNMKHHAGQLQTQFLVNPKNLCYIDSGMPIFADAHDESACEIPTDDGKLREKSDKNVISKLKNGKNLSNSNYLI